jgi:hypothetical protein
VSGSGQQASPATVLIWCALAVAIAYGAWPKAYRKSVNVDWDSLAVAGIMSQAGSGVSLPGNVTAMPGYAVFLAGLATVDARTARATREALICVGEGHACTQAPILPIVVLIQYGLALACLVLVALLTAKIAGSYSNVLLAAALFFATTYQGSWAGSLQPAMLFQTIVLLAAFLVLVTLERGRLASAAGSGVAAVAATFVEPSAFVLVPMIPVVFALRFFNRHRRKGVTALFAVLAAIGTTIGLSAGAQTLGYQADWIVSHIGADFVQRGGYNDLDIRSWPLGLVYFTPLIGDLLASTVVPSQVAQQLGDFVWGSILYDPRITFLARVQQQDAGPIYELSQLVETRVYRQGSSFVAACAPVLLRGFWSTTGLFGLLGAMQLRRMWSYARVDNRLPELGALVALAASMLFASTLMTANLPGHNPLMPVVFALALAFTAAGW